jgi:O-antigen/teichoic acid export membrane protein
MITYIHPLVFKAHESGLKHVVERLVNKALVLYTLAGLALAAVLILAEDRLILLIAGETYRLERGVFPMLVAGSFCLGFYRFLATHYYLRQSTLELAACYALGFLVSLGTAVLLVRQHGLLGVAAGLLAGAALLCVLVWWRGRRVLYINPLRGWPRGTRSG